MVNPAVATGCEANQSVFKAASLNVRAEGSVMLVNYSLYTCFDQIKRFQCDLAPVELIWV